MLEEVHRQTGMRSLHRSNKDTAEIFNAKIFAVDGKRKKLNEK